MLNTIKADVSMSRNVGVEDFSGETYRRRANRVTMGYGVKNENRNQNG